MIKLMIMGLVTECICNSRFLHNPRATEGFVGSALYGNIYRFYKTDKGDWAAHKASF